MEKDAGPRQVGACDTRQRFKGTLGVNAPQNEQCVARTERTTPGYCQVPINWPNRGNILAGIGGFDDPARIHSDPDAASGSATLNFHGRKCPCRFGAKWG
jgi:hypothetical protein